MRVPLLVRNGELIFEILMVAISKLPFIVFPVRQIYAYYNDAEAALTGLVDEVIGKILWKNAAKLYGVNMPTSFFTGASAPRQVLMSAPASLHGVWLELIDERRRPGIEAWINDGNFES
jgi:hypothetical protein